MAKDTLNELKEILKDDAATDSIILRMFIAHQIDRAEKQDKINVKVEKMFPWHKIHVAVAGLLGIELFAFMWGLLTDKFHIIPGAGP